jgi:hypothetical protein
MMGHKRQLIVVGVLLIATWLTFDDYANFQKALTAKDASVCERLRLYQFQDACYGGVGIATNDANLCVRPNNPDERYRCLGVVEANATICLKIGKADTRDFCYYYVAVRRAEPQICQQVEDAQRRDECKAKATDTEHLQVPIQKPPLQNKKQVTY